MQRQLPNFVRVGPRPNEEWLLDRALVANDWYAIWGAGDAFTRREDSVACSGAGRPTGVELETPLTSAFRQPLTAILRHGYGAP